MSAQNFVSYGDAETIFTEVGDALANKADLVSGKVPASQLPSYVDDSDIITTAEIDEMFE